MPLVPKDTGLSQARKEAAAVGFSSMGNAATSGVRAECRKGIEWYEAGEGGDGLQPETVRWARKLRDGDSITPDKARKMSAWLARHEVDKQGEGFSPGEKGYPSPGRVAWALWGGDPAVGWSAKLVRQIDAAAHKNTRRGA